MRCQLAVFSIFASLVLMTWASVPVLADGPEAPVWTDGDFWKYKGTIQAEGITMELTMKLEVSGTDQVSVKGTVYECYHMDGTVSMKVQGISLSVEMDMWVQVSDIASVRVRTSVLGETTQISYHPPVPYPWPLEVGKEWNGTTTIITESSSMGNSEETANYTAEIERSTAISVPAGTFETYEIRLTMQGTDSRNYYAPEVGYDIRVASSELFGSDMPVDLVDFKFGSRRPAGSDALNFIWYVLIIVIAVVIAAVAILGWRMRRRAAAWSEETPTEQPRGEPPPPPDW